MPADPRHPRLAEVPESLLASVVEGSLAGVMVYRSIRDGAGEIFDFDLLLVNPAALRMLGRPASDFLGRRMSEVYPDNWKYHGLFYRYRDIVEERIPSFTDVLQHPESRRWWQVSAVKAGDGFAVHFIEVSDFKRTEAELRESMNEQERLARVQTDFISTVSHQLRTPLTSIRGSLSLLASGVAGPIGETAQQMVDIARRNTERLLALINDLLDIQQIESGGLEVSLREMEVMPLVQQALEDNRTLGSQLGVRFLLARTAPGVCARIDANRFLQVMANLLSNAAKFSPPQGDVEVTVDREDNRLRIAVRDHGPGIPEEFRARVFDRFAQADSSSTRPQGGTGLGLNITKALVERMGGSITFETAMGAGTTFTFELPAVGMG
ncbi:MAG TPA: ATP-binding protein [Thermoanaerobaculia bacterium]|nr:ATP-binding protein [Thermoanaerobaculia bacterium]